MLKRISIFIAVICLLALPIAQAKIISGINMPDSLMAGQTKLILNGAGVRSKFFFDIYVGGLYLKKKSTHDKNIIEADESMAIRLHITSGLITSEKMEKATREGFDTSTNGNIGPIKSQIEEFLSLFKDVIQENDTYNFVYIPKKGVTFYKNDNLKATIKGLNFKKALFGIWLGSDPADDDLKEGMLGD